MKRRKRINRIAGYLSRRSKQSKELMRQHVMHLLAVRPLPLGKAS